MTYTHTDGNISVDQIETGHSLTLYDKRYTGENLVYRRGYDGHYLEGNVYAIEGDTLRLMRYDVETQMYIYFDIDRRQIQDYIDSDLVNLVVYEQ